jgi:cob(I)alamin adenosyltransferase
MIDGAMKIYTRTGDDGTTGLFGGTRVSKADPRIECIGAIDELNAAIGLARCCADVAVSPWLAEVQNELFVVGARLATPGDRGEGSRLPALAQGMIDRLEQQIDGAEAELTPLRQFILPGGGEAAARLHLARAVCRRAERLLVALASQQTVEPMTLTYVNRLSDWLFVLARLSNRRSGVPDVPWQKPQT